MTVASALSTASLTALSLSNLIVVSAQKETGYQPQSEDQKSLGESILFHYEGDQSIQLNSDITDHYVEDNTAKHDQIGLKPERYTTRGYIGELNDVIPKEAIALKTIADKLVVMSAYTPELTIAGLVAFNQAKQVYDTALAVKEAYQTVAKWKTNKLGFGDSTKPQTKQAIVYQLFYGYWAARTLFTVQTPWTIMNDMAIESLKSVQGEDSNSVSDFEITFKKMRFASTKEVLSSSSDIYTNMSREVKDIGQGTTGPDVVQRLLTP